MVWIGILCVLPVALLPISQTGSVGNKEFGRTSGCMMMVGNLQKQLQTCMDQNADLIKHIFSATGNESTGKDIGEKVAFHAGLSKKVENLPSRYKLIFDYVYLNEGKGYDPHTGVFICPVDGIYVFHWTILTLKGKYFYTNFVVNGTVVGRSHLKAANADRQASSMVVQKIQKGEKAWIEPYTSHIGQYAYSRWSFFSGFKI